MRHIINIGKEYINLKNQEKLISKDAKKLNEQLKDYFKDTNQNELVVDDKIIYKQVQDRSTMNEDKLLTKLKLLGKTGAIKTKEYVDVETLNDLMFKGELSPDDISECVVNKTISMIKIKKNK